MKRSTIVGCANLKWLFPFLLLVVSFLPLRSWGQTESIDFKQSQNGDPAAFPITWTNGILNATQTTFYEGVGIPQRMIFTGLKTNTLYRMQFNFLAGIPNKGVHAFDFLMSWEQAVLTARRIGGAASGTETENELAHLFDADVICENAPAACAALSGSLPANQVARPKVPDMDDPLIGNVPNFYSDVQANIDCFEGVNGSNYGDRDIEMRSDGVISDVNFVFLGYDKNYARFELSWKSTGTQMLIRYASRPAVGNGGTGNFACGYGINEGAGAISGGNYHNIFETLLENGTGTSVINGSRDNQLMSGAITPINPPTCPTPIANQTKCEDATSFTYTVPNPEADVTYTWTINAGNTAGAQLQGTAPVTGTSVTVVPTGSAFTPGSFTLTLTLTKAGTAVVTCPSITGTVAATPAKPTICEVPLSLCPAGGATTITLKVGNLQANAYYRVTQGTSPTFSYDQTQQAPATVTSSTVLTFTGLAPGGGLNVQGENRVSSTLSCFGTAATCTDLITCPPPTSSITKNTEATKEDVQAVDARIISDTKTKVLAAPNPFSGRVRFTLQSDVSGQGSLEIYNTMGQKIATVYQGHVEAGKVLSKEYVTPRSLRANLIYIFRVGDQKTTGKLLNW